MLRRRTRFALLAAAAVVATFELSSCGGSGGGGGTTGPPPAKELDSPTLSQSQTFTHRFFAAATFPYHCSIHPSMTGSVIVSDTAPAGDTVLTVSINGMAAPQPFGPPSVTLRTGGKVVWTNNNASPHTVTSN